MEEAERIWETGCYGCTLGCMQVTPTNGTCGTDGFTANLHPPGARCHAINHWYHHTAWMHHANFFTCHFRAIKNRRFNFHNLASGRVYRQRERKHSERHYGPVNLFTSLVWVILYISSSSKTTNRHLCKVQQCAVCTCLWSSGCQHGAVELQRLRLSAEHMTWKQRQKNLIFSYEWRELKKTKTPNCLLLSRICPLTRWWHLSTSRQQFLHFLQVANRKVSS